MGILNSKCVSRFASVAWATTVLSVLTVTYADPDLWGHIRFGADIVSARTARIPDRYSFLSDVPWINHEWLSEVLMYGAYALGRGPGLVLLKVVLLLLMLRAVGTALPGARQRTLMRDGLIGVLVVATIGQSILVRPQLFSLVLFAWLLAALLRFRDTPWTWLPIPIMVVWANLHGGWVVGAGTLVLWSGLAFYCGQSGRDAFRTCFVSALSLVATALNPFGLHLWTFVASTVGFQRPDIADWQPIINTAPIYIALWMGVAILFLTWTAAALRRGELLLQPTVLSFALGAAAFKVSRLQSFFVISVVMLIGYQLSHRTPARPVPVKLSESNELRGGWRLVVALVLFVGVFAVNAIASAYNVGCIRIAPAQFPDPEVVPFVTHRPVYGRMLTWFGWGEYAIWYWSDHAIYVSMDGRRETVYSNRVMSDHLNFYFDRNNREESLERINPDYVWLPTDLEAVAWLKAHGWHELFVGSQSTLLARGVSGDLAVVRSSPTPGRRCFPGP